jgi:hypothetical protein
MKAKKERRGRPTKLKPEHLKQIRECGRKGLIIRQAAEAMGVPANTLLTWERRRPDFRKAAARVRKNSERYKAERNQRLLEKTESELLAALEFVREKQRKEQEKLLELARANNWYGWDVQGRRRARGRETPPIDVQTPKNVTLEIVLTQYA